MKVLLCTVTVGEGLNSICKAVANELNECGVENEILNVFKDNAKRENYNTNVYYKIVRTFPHIILHFQKKFGNYNRNLNRLKKPSLIQKEIDTIAPVLIKKCTEENYDVIYTPVASIAITAAILNQQNKIKTKVFYSIPDFNIPTYIEVCKNRYDGIITSCQEVFDNFVKYGFDKKKLFNYGIPVNKNFFEHQDKNTLKKQFGFNDSDFIVLVMYGGAGAANTLSAIKKFCKFAPNVKYIVVNGKNEKQKSLIDKYIEKNSLKNITNYGYCTNIKELMTISDVAFTKLGAATMCECYAKNLPIVSVKQKLYPEYDNLKHLKKHSAAVECKSYKNCAEVILKLKDDKKYFNEIKNNYNNIFNKDAANQIAKLICYCYEQSNIT